MHMMRGFRVYVSNLNDCVYISNLNIDFRGGATST